MLLCNTGLFYICAMTLYPFPLVAQKLFPFPFAREFSFLRTPLVRVLFSTHWLQNLATVITWTKNNRISWNNYNWWTTDCGRTCTKLLQRNRVTLQYLFEYWTHFKCLTWFMPVIFLNVAYIAIYCTLRNSDSSFYSILSWYMNMAAYVLKIWNKYNINRYDTIQTWTRKKLRRIATWGHPTSRQPFWALIIRYDTIQTPIKQQPTNLTIPQPSRTNIALEYRISTRSDFFRWKGYFGNKWAFISVFGQICTVQYSSTETAMSEPSVKIPTSPLDSASLISWKEQ